MTIPTAIKMLQMIQKYSKRIIDNFKYHMIINSIKEIVKEHKCLNKPKKVTPTEYTLLNICRDKYRSQSLYSYRNYEFLYANWRFL